MTVRDYTAGATRYKWPGSLQAIEDILSFTLDMSANNQTAADVANCISVKAGMEVVSVVVEVITAEGATLTVDVGDGDDIDGYIDGMDGNTVGFKKATFLTTAVSVDPASLVDALGTNGDITVTGAVIGDQVNIAPGVDLEELILTAYVRAANTVEWQLQNESASTVNLASSIWVAEVWKSTEVYAPRGKLYAADDTIDMVINDTSATAVLRIMARVIDWGLASAMP